jgi:inorganic pyrophosphatase
MSQVMNCMQLSRTGPREGTLHVVVETPKGSRNKYKYDEAIGLFRLDRVLPAGASFPFDFGFIPATRAEDGDPLDVLVLLPAATAVGCLVTARLIGVIEVEQTETSGKKVRNDRLLSVLDTEQNPARIESLDQLDKQCLEEIEHFFISYNQWAGKEFRPLARHGPRRAWQSVEECARRFERNTK